MRRKNVSIKPLKTPTGQPIKSQSSLIIEESKYEDNEEGDDEGDFDPFANFEKNL